MGIYEYVLSIHLIFMVAWMSGLFFLGRAMIYYAEAETSSDKLAIQSFLTGGMRRVSSIIIWPSLLATVAGGLYLAIEGGAFSMPWMHLKLLLVVIMIGYTHGLWSLSKKMISGRKKPTSTRLRFLNELPFVFLITIVFAAVLKDPASALLASAGCIFLFMLLGLAYRRFAHKAA